VSQSSYHQAFWAEPTPRNGRLLTPAGAINHTDEELEFLAGLVNQRTAWQVAGRKGVKDGRGQMDYSAPPGSAGNAGNTGSGGGSGSGAEPSPPPAPAPAAPSPAPASRARPASPYGPDY